MILGPDLRARVLLNLTNPSPSGEAVTNRNVSDARAPQDAYEKTSGSERRALASTGAPPPADPARLADAHRTRVATNVGGSSPSNAPTSIRDRAHAVYEKNGKTMYDLSNRDQVRELIRNSPQIDKVKDTTSDPYRCAAASTFNALLADGGASKNAEAIRKSAAQLHRPLSKDESRALDNMASGRMCPEDAARTQNVLFELAQKSGKACHGRVPHGEADGMTPFGTARLLSQLRANGGFENTQKVVVTSSYDGAGSGTHATVTHYAKGGGVLHADSWPDANGRATAQEGGGGPGPLNTDGVRNSRVKAEVTVEFGDNDSHYDVRFGVGRDSANYRRYSGSTPKNGVPLPERDFKAEDYTRNPDGKYNAELRPDAC